MNHSYRGAAGFYHFYGRQLLNQLLTAIVLELLVVPPQVGEDNGRSSPNPKRCGGGRGGITVSGGPCTRNRTQALALADTASLE